MSLPTISRSSQRGRDSHDANHIRTNPPPKRPADTQCWVTAVREAKIVRNGKPVHLPIRSLRKAHATWQAERGTHETVLQGLLGHAKGSDVTKRFYVQVSEEAKRQAMLSLPFAVNAN